ncbi:oligosaccharide flippase family protein [Rhodanobacter lindaniclasticus]
MAWSSVVGIVVMVAGRAVWGWQYRVKGFSLVHWKRVFGFGSNRTIADIARQVGDQSANLVIGRMLGMADTGLYSRGYGIVNMYSTAVVGKGGNPEGVRRASASCIGRVSSQALVSTGMREPGNVGVAAATGSGGRRTPCAAWRCLLCRSALVWRQVRRSGARIIDRRQRHRPGDG